MSRSRLPGARRAVRMYGGATPPRSKSRVSHVEPPEPQFRWTFETWIAREWRDWRHVRRGDIVQKRTMTVTAPTEAAAKRKIEAALPDAPRHRDEYDCKEETHLREWSLVGSIEEVE